MNRLNDLHFFYRIVRSNFGSLPSPYKLNLMVTTRCNQRCHHCGIHDRPVQDLPLEVIRDVLRSNPQLSWLDVTGGEIFLRPDIEELFAIIGEEGRRLALLHFPTNGTMPELTSRITKKIVSKVGQG